VEIKLRILEAIKAHVDRPDVYIESTEVRAHAELAARFLGEGLRMADRDPVQACEKLYKGLRRL